MSERECVCVCVFDAQFFQKQMDDRTMYYGLITLGALVRLFFVLFFSSLFFSSPVRFIMLCCVVCAW